MTESITEPEVLEAASASQAAETVPDVEVSEPTAAEPVSEADSENSDSEASSEPAAESAATSESSAEAPEPAAEAASSKQRDARSVGLIALPVQTSQLIKKYGVNHPGLVLNKYAVLLRLQDRRLQYDFAPEQKKRILQKVTHLLASNAELKAQWSQALESRNKLLKLEGARQLSLSSSSPMSFAVYHPFAELGVELHPLYGFPYIPAAHLKGALRRYVQQHWLPGQSENTAAQAEFEQVFGAAGKETAGQILFHDVWPDNWPSLAVESLVNHHAPYYQRQQAAGDWQEPQLESFLVIKPGSRFSFAWSRRTPEVSDSLMHKLEGWLQGLLQSEGLGAYRQLGFGQWKLGETQPAGAWQTQLSLSSPAFLAGASYRPEDCRLRPHTLKGLLRWWWRTMHTGYLGHRELLTLESLIWGSAKRKGAVRLNLEPGPNVQSRRYRPEDLLRQLPGPEGERRSPGLVYLGYGLFSESSKRYYMGSDANWTLQVEVQNATLHRKEGNIEISAEQVLAQVQAAVWLLCHYGGLGQRKRKGFGSLLELEGLGLSAQTCMELGQALREHCQLSEEFEPERAESPALHNKIETAEVPTTWKNPWFALHQLGESLQSFMQQHKHEAIKQALGLPRPMDPPVHGEFVAAEPVKQRYAAPFYLHLSRNPEQQLSLRLVGFPAAKLPNLETSQQILQQLLDYLQQDLSERAQRWAEEPVIDLNAPPPQRSRSRRPEKAERPSSFGRPYIPGRPKEEGEQSPETGAERPRRKPAGQRQERKPRPERWERSERKPRQDRPDRPERPRREREGGPERKFSPRGDKAPVRSGPRAPQAGDWVQAVLLEERTKKGGWRAEFSLPSASKLAGPLVNTGLVPAEQNAGDSVELIIHSLNKFEMIFRWPTEAERAQKDQPAKAKARKAQA